MKKFVGKLRCCSSVVILMSFVILGAIKEKNFSGYEEELQLLTFFNSCCLWLHMELFFF